MNETERRKIKELYREATEENHDFDIDDVVDRITRSLGLRQTPEERRQLEAFVHSLHADRARSHSLDYVDVSEQSFPASDPPPVP